ncbi:hypothetical protein BDR03DRAFT_939489, partial [Suillus americanus]
MLRHADPSYRGTLASILVKQMSLLACTRKQQQLVQELQGLQEKPQHTHLVLYHQSSPHLPVPQL